MQKLRQGALIFLLLLGSAALLIAQNTAQDKSPNSYNVLAIQPKPVTETFWGVSVVDPYRNLENLDDPDVKAWYANQAKHAQNTLESIPGRKRLLDKIQELDQRVTVKVWGIKVSKNSRRFYYKMNLEDQTPKVYWQQGFQADEHLIFDPSRLDNDSIHHAVSDFTPSLDGSKLAVGVSANGSESAVVYILNVESGKAYPEQIDRNWGGWVSWLPDGEHFFINRVKTNDVHQADRLLDSKTYLHRLGTDPSTDREYFSRALYPDLGMKPEDYPEVSYDDNCQCLLAGPRTVDSRWALFTAPLTELDKPQTQWQRLFRTEDEVYDFVFNGQDVYYLTAKNAPRMQLMKTSLALPEVSAATLLVPESDEKKNYIYATSEGLFLTTMKNGIEAHLYQLPYGTTKLLPVQLPIAAGSLYFQVKGCRYPDRWVNLSGWTRQNERYRFDLKSRQFIREQLTTEAKFPEFDNLVVEELMIPGHDGIQVPLSLIYQKNLERNSTAPVLMVGYGAYGVTASPNFLPAYLPWTLEGGILAIAHVRGGGELGEGWHRAGMKTTKPNTWKDAIACADFLIKNKYTAAGKIVINGGSAGGVLVGRAMTERPDLWAAAVPEVGCLNPLRQEFSANGPGNIPEFGTVKDSVEFRALLAMDAYQHLKPGVKYPAVLITSGFNDPRVVAWQPGKFAARLQECNTSGKPVLFHTDFEGGHGMGDTKDQWFGKIANLLSFGLWQTGTPGFLSGSTKP